MALREAIFYKSDKEDVKCTLCAHQCRIRQGMRGICGVRQNIEGKLYSLVYGELVAEHIDPIEKKPLFHVLPGSLSLSISTVGCNFKCRHCQNSSISQVSGLPVSNLGGRRTSPDEVVGSALRNECQTISYTYVEPTVFYEFAFDCAVTASHHSLRNIFVSNGYISAGAARKIAPYLHAINIDVKAFSDQFYQKVCGARLKPVLDCVRLMKELGVWVEVTTLVIPGMNDSDEELSAIASFLVSVDSSIPWHVTGFHPTYKMMDRPPTSSRDLLRASRIGRDAGLSFVYQGNAAAAGGENTLCPTCGEMLIERRGYSILRNLIKDGRCPECKAVIAGVWS